MGKQEALSSTEQRLPVAAHGSAVKRTGQKISAVTGQQGAPKLAGVASLWRTSSLAGLWRSKVVILAGAPCWRPQLLVPALSPLRHRVPLLLLLHLLQLPLQALQVQRTPAPQQAARERVQVPKGDGGQTPAGGDDIMVTLECVCVAACVLPQQGAAWRRPTCRRSPSWGRSAGSGRGPRGPPAAAAPPPCT